MSTLIRLIEWESFLLLFLLALAVVVGAARGTIRSTGLLDGIDYRGVRFASTGRTQLLLSTAAIIVNYVSQLVSKPTAFPHLPSTWLALLSGSHLFYLGSKYSSLRRPHS
jgi:hypothetical protein